MRITHLPHARRRMEERRISEEEVESRHRGVGSAHASGGPGRRRTVAYRLEHDPESGAFYIRIRDGEYHETIRSAGRGLSFSSDRGSPQHLPPVR
jgi:hypothetical protein